MFGVVRNYSGRRIAKGGTVFVYGSGFSASIKAWMNDTLLTLVDYDYGKAVFIGVSYPGSYTLFVGDSDENRIAIGSVNVVDDLNKLHLYRIGIPSSDDVCGAMLGLLPRGFAWYKGLDGNFARLMRGLSAVVTSIYQLVVNYQEQSSPSHTDSFDAWERELRLPEDGAKTGDTDVDRREEIYRKACRKGGVTVPYFLSLAALFGRDIWIYEYWKNPEKFEDVDFGEDDPNFYWMLEVEASPDDWYECTCNDTCNDYLQRWWNGSIESMFDAIKPAHTKLLYAYVEVEREFVLVDNDDNVIVTPERVPVAAAVLSAEIVNPGTTVLPDGTTARTVRIKDLPDAGDDNGYIVRDSEDGGTGKTRAYTEQEIDELWDSTPAEEDEDA